MIYLRYFASLVITALCWNEVSPALGFVWVALHVMAEITFDRLHWLEQRQKWLREEQEKVREEIAVIYKAYKPYKPETK